MTKSQRDCSPFVRFNSWISTILNGSLLAALVLCAPHIQAQQLTGTLSGTVYDQSEALVPGAKVVLKNMASGDERTTTSGSDGHFVITAVQPATYSITISADNFNTWQVNGIVMSVGDNRVVPNIRMQVGGNTEVVKVEVGTDAVVPTDTAEISTALNQQMINDFPLQGRNVGDIMKIVPGMALNSGMGQGSSFKTTLVGTNNGPAGAYSSDGTQPYGTMAYMLDGANLVDPGNSGTQIANINPDMVGNIKVLTSTYGAEYAKGPVIFQAFSRSGGQSFHGEAYLYTRNAALDSIDAYEKAQGLTNAAQSYYYIGGNVGGPLLLPWVRFNQKRNKLFFWGGYEYMKQQPAGSAINYNVPNAAQLSGDFSNNGIPAGAINAWPKFYDQLTQNVPSGGTATSIPTSAIDPNIKGILNLYPATNQAPSSANGFTNYQYVNTSPQNRWEATGKVDYSISDNDKVSASYSYQLEHDLAPISIWWATPNTLPYPSPAASDTASYVLLTNYTHVFSATTTNEFVFTWSHFKNPYALANPSKVSRTTNNFNVNGLFNHTTAQIPNFNPDYCCSEQMASLNYYPMTPGSFGGVKQVPAFYDNFTKVLGPHTLKAGFYWDTQKNFQNSNSADNGTFSLQTYGQNSTTNLVADTMLGHINSYSQQNTSPAQDIMWHQWSIFGQDSWKASKGLTVNLGLRLDHIGQWYGEDFQVWDPATYVNSAAAPNNTGLAWHAINSSIPESGFPSRLFFYAPRVGVAYDLFGNGRTVLRGGFGTYYYQVSTEVGNAANGPLGSFNFTTPNVFNGYASIQNGGPNFTPPSSVAQNGASIYAMQMGDDRVPFTTNWNATVSQALPRRSVLEITYIGNRSANQYMDGTNSNLYNINNVSPGGFFQPDPVQGQLVSPNAPPCSTTNPANQSLYCQSNPVIYGATFTANNYRPLVAYQNIFILSHASYARYNGLQTSYQKQSGPVTFVANYTFSKVLGTRDGVSNNGQGNGTAVDPFVIDNNYGPLAYDHTHILNLTYNWQLPSLIQTRTAGMKILGGITNGWMVSGYTAFQSGAPIQANTPNLNATYPSGLTVPTVANPGLPDNSIKMANGLVANAVNPSTWFGSNAYNVLVPALSCNPLSGLHSVHTSAGTQSMRFNPACFTVPAYGQQGAINMPYMRNPNYWNSDLGIYKSFHIKESQSIQVRISATNWLNHPLGQFGLAGNSDIGLNFQQSTPATCGGCSGNVVSQSPTNVNSSTTGAPAFKTGSRVLTMAAKYYF